MKKRILVLFFVTVLLLVTLACVTPYEYEQAQDEANIPPDIKRQWEDQAIIKAQEEQPYTVSDLSGFEPVSESGGLIWDCNDSLKNGQQEITKVGDHLEFICIFGIAHYRFID